MKKLLVILVATTGLVTTAFATGSQVKVPLSLGLMTPNLLVALDPATVTADPGATGISISPDGKTVVTVDAGSNLISQYARNADGKSIPDGKLFRLPSIAAGNVPVGIIMSHSGTDVYVVNQNDGVSNGTVLEYKRNVDGTLYEVGSIDAGVYASGITMFQSDDCLYVTNNFNYTVSEYSRSSNGGLSAIGTVGVGDRDDPVGITSVQSAGISNVYVLNPNNNTISQYQRGSTLCQLYSLGDIGTGDKPSGIIVSPDGKNVYVTNYNETTISQYSRDNILGLLTPLTPFMAKADGGANGITISSDGTYVYVTNVLSDDISELTRDLVTGQLTLVGNIGTGLNPNGIILSPDGANAYVANNDENASSISQYSR